MEVRILGVVGSGQMGSGIAQVAAASGLQVIMNDISAEFVERGKASIEKNLERMVQKEKISAEEKNAIMSRIKGSTSLEDMKEADFVVEAAIEKVDVKLEIFRRLDAVCKPGTVLASNTFMRSWRT